MQQALIEPNNQHGMAMTMTTPTSTENNPIYLLNIPSIGIGGLSATAVILNATGHWILAAVCVGWVAAVSFRCLAMLIIKIGTSR